MNNSGCSLDRAFMYIAFEVFVRFCVKVSRGLAWRAGLQSITPRHQPSHPLLYQSLHPLLLQFNSNKQKSFFFSLSLSVSHNKNGRSNSFCIQGYNAIQERKSRPFRVIVLWVTFSFLYATPWRFRSFPNIGYTTFLFRLWLCYYVFTIFQGGFFYDSDNCVVWGSISALSFDSTSSGSVNVIIDHENRDVRGWRKL